jgi:predicted peroxiredoxin
MMRATRRKAKLTSSSPTTNTATDRDSIGGSMSTLLVHITCGPEAPTRAALGFLVAKAALEEGHEVSLFLAGDGVQLLRDSVLDSLNGLGTGSLRESYDAVAAGGGRFYVSGMSSKARGVTVDDLADKPAEMAMPNRLVQLAFEADRTLTY